MDFEFRTGFGTNLFENDRSEPVIFRNGSFITGNVLVEPLSRSAREMPEGKVLDYEKYAQKSVDVIKRLRIYAFILEQDIVPYKERED